MYVVIKVDASSYQMHHTKFCCFLIGGFFLPSARNGNKFRKYLIKKISETSWDPRLTLNSQDQMPRDAVIYEKIIFWE